LIRGVSKPEVVVRRTVPADFPRIVEICERVYPTSPPWTPGLLQSHLDVFPEGQLVAVRSETGLVVGMAASLIVLWSDYEITGTWGDFTARGRFTNHDPCGRTLYGAEVMVDPGLQRSGVGKRMYAARRELCRRLGLLRIRAGARLVGYGDHADRMSAEEYVLRVVRGELGDPTLSFQLRQGFRVLAVVEGYLNYDPKSLGWAAVIEWINHDVARRDDWRGRDPRFGRPRGGTGASSSRPPDR
jgi:ribosomal protein S18 acetylase RimI-like enzyme